MKTKLLEMALSQYGIKEIVGQYHNNEVVKYFTEIGFAQITNDETAWCSAFVNWVCMKAGYEHTKKLNARSWLTIGKETIHPEPGDIVIMSRGTNPSLGHVGFFINKDQKYIYILGGNQSNQVNITAYNKASLLGYRVLSSLSNNHL